MTLKNRVKKLEKTANPDERERECISAWSEQELKEKLEEYRQKNPDKPEPFTILTTIIESREDLEK